tara:strand:- start:2315 stop:3148 length:834 start_codon:yes stop_codon:yes gene_type:complete
MPTDTPTALDETQSENNIAAPDVAAEAAAASASKDWRVRLALAPGSKYLYNSDTPGILAPLVDTDGVVFPYTPAISVAYQAEYDQQSLTHTNYQVNSYKSSMIGSITLTCDFTCQDTKEANYLLACIHFFRSMTKMFYGQDENPKGGTPPPLSYLYGLGQFQFDKNPLAITTFTYSLPTDVDYILSTNTADNAEVKPKTKFGNFNRGGLIGGQLKPGGSSPFPNFRYDNDITQTYVPTKMSITIACIPIISRSKIANDFSLKEYASGNLLLNGGGFW